MVVTKSNEWITITDFELVGYSYLHAIQSITTTGSFLLNYDIVESESIYQFEMDGYYIITSIRLLNTNTSGEYWTDGSKIYNPNGDEISVEDLLEITDFPIDLDIIREDSEYLLYYYLNNYYLSFINDKFANIICGRCQSTSNNVTQDTLVMGLYLIEYLEENEQYYEAQRIIEQLSACVGLSTASNCNCG